MGDDTPAAVLVPVRQGDVTELGFVVRSPESTTHAGHVGFPGGKTEPVDESLADTARRETAEETALDRADLSLQARLDPHHTRSTGFAVTPFLATVENDGRFVPDSREVVETFWASVPQLRAAYAMDGDRIRFPLEEGEVWGLTGRIVVTLLVTGLTARLE